MNFLMSDVLDGSSHANDVTSGGHHGKLKISLLSDGLAMFQK